MMVTDVQAFGMVKELAAREGVLGGSSAGANVYAAAVEIAGKRLRGREARSHADSRLRRTLCCRRRFSKAES
jgi:cysteine synthase